MKKLMVHLATAVAMLTPLSVAASQNAISGFRSNIGLEFYWEDYTELLFSGKQTFMNTKGPVGSLYFQTFYPFAKDFKILFSARYSMGSLKYTGGYQSLTGKMTQEDLSLYLTDQEAYSKKKQSQKKRVITYNTPMDVLDLRLLLGYQLPIKHPVDFRLGLGYRLHRTEESGIGSYDRYNSRPYIHLAMGTDLKFGNFALSPLVGYNMTVAAAHISVINNEVVVNKQPIGHGIEFELLASYKTNNFKYSIGPFFRLWKIPESKKYYTGKYMTDLNGNPLKYQGDTDITAEDGKTYKKGDDVKIPRSYLEPQNDTYEIGVKFQIDF